MARWHTTRSWKLGLAALAAVGAVAVSAACGGQERKQVSDELGTQLQQILDRATASPKTVFPGTSLYVSQPELGTWAGAAGDASIEPARPMRAQDTFRTGSITKPFVAAAVLQLAEEGKLSLDDPLPAVLPRDVVARFPEAGRITVRMLLNHTSGLPEFDDHAFDLMVIADPERVWTVDELLDRAAAMPPIAAPGEGFHYSNTNYVLLGQIIEHTTGKSWRTVVTDRIIDRLGLKHTSLPEPGNVSIGDDAAHGYELIGGKLRDYTNVDASMAGAAGGNSQVTTTEDLGRFMDALLSGKLFDRPETLRQMLTFVPAKDPHNPLLVGYGLGIERYLLPDGNELLGHLGTGAGYRAYVGRLTAQHAVVSMMINNPDNPLPVLMPAVELMLAKSPQSAPPA
jgi:D-alanyl-D-alanine carboxypeptidase